jgi:hypothetical protein
MPIGVDVKIDRKSKKVILDIKNTKKKTKDGTRRGFYLIGKDLTKDSQQSIIKGPKTGRLYIRKVNGRRRRHRASAPGQPPANFRGGLQRSVNFRVKGFEDMLFGSERIRHKGIDVNYGRALELGATRTGRSRKGVIKKREFLIRSIKKRQKVTRNYFVQELKKRLKR